ncbi:hypothetical protein HDU96_000704 [Phlyctochytrium bullatum]|nr:hypothetical protein HDU96_000704 [Phlyctochytrium bullatum]
MLTHFPSEVVLHLSYFLTLDDLIHVSRASARFRSLLMDHLVVREFDASTDLAVFHKKVLAAASSAPSATVPSSSSTESSALAPEESVEVEKHLRSPLDRERLAAAIAPWDPDCAESCNLHSVDLSQAKGYRPVAQPSTGTLVKHTEGATMSSHKGKDASNVNPDTTTSPLASREWIHPNNKRVLVAIIASQLALSPHAYTVLTSLPASTPPPTFLTSVAQALREELQLHGLPTLPPNLTLEAVQTFFDVDDDPWSYAHPVGTPAWHLAPYISHEVMMRARELASESEAKRVDDIAVEMARARWAASRVLTRAGRDFVLAEDDAVNLAALRAEAVDRGALPALHPGVRTIAERAVTVERFGVSEMQLMDSARRGDLLTVSMRIVNEFMADEDVVALRFPPSMASEHRKVLRWACERGVYHRIIDADMADPFLPEEKRDRRPTLYLSKHPWPPF